MNEQAIDNRNSAKAIIFVTLLLAIGYAVLRDIGLRQVELPTALLFFNVGVEIGQIPFVLLLIATFFILRPAFVRLLQSARDQEIHWSTLTAPASYIIGSVASFWMVEHVVDFRA